MKVRKLLDKLNKYTGLGENADKKQVRKLRNVLRALKDKQDELQLKLEAAEGTHERRKLEQQLEVIRRQRQKGQEVYKSIKDARPKQ
jgi:predicted  nucleic acid-binding Zn-ribbon protein